MAFRLCMFIYQSECIHLHCSVFNFYNEKSIRVVIYNKEKKVRKDYLILLAPENKRSYSRTHVRLICDIPANPRLVCWPAVRDWNSGELKQSMLL
jgi:hypothetical protein